MKNKYLEKIADTMIEDSYYVGIPSSKVVLDDVDLARIHDRYAIQEAGKVRDRMRGDVRNSSTSTGSKVGAVSGAGLLTLLSQYAQHESRIPLKGRLLPAVATTAVGAGLGAGLGAITGNIVGRIKGNLDPEIKRKYLEAISENRKVDPESTARSSLWNAVSDINREERYQASPRGDNTYVSIPIGQMGSYMNVRQDLIDKMRRNELTDINRPTLDADTEEWEQYADEKDSIFSKDNSEYMDQLAARIRRKIGL